MRSDYPMTFSRHRSQAGYTLAEMAIAIIVIGIFIAGTMSAYHMYRIEQKNEKTEFKRLRIDFALNDFKKRHGRYPCPARYDIGRDNPNYGYEGNCADTSVAAGVCSDGICVERSIREVQIGDGSYIRPRVRRGAVPFRVLNLAERDSYDEYGGRFSYAVTELLTDWQTFDVKDGGINVVDGQDPSEENMVDPAGSALYFVFSHGSDHVGAYNEAGSLILPCTGLMFDNQSCNTSPADDEAIYRYTEPSEVAIDLGGSSSEGGGGEDEGEEPPPTGVNLNKHYDDYSVYKGADVAPLWKMSDESGHELDAHDIGPVDQNISIANGGVSEKLNVGGDMAVTDNYLTTKICDLNGGDCFESSDIGGPEGMGCPAGQVAYGIGERHLRCRIPAFKCPSGQYLSGFVN
ncbi:MAG TPA: prepilin-type N-terminal cleavage/methylation domain-containing protein, partial [Micavibrio sp.]|nr:prepilin-type N-terminal cleavage/methylation domain-containing protein [Micavibrio sp.]